MTGSYDKQLIWWHMERTEPESVMEGQRVTDLAVSADGSRLVLITPDKKIKMYSLPDMSLIPRSIPQVRPPLAVSAELGWAQARAQARASALTGVLARRACKARSTCLGCHREAPAVSLAPWRRLALAASWRAVRERWRGEHACLERGGGGGCLRVLWAAAARPAGRCASAQLVWVGAEVCGRGAGGGGQGEHHVAELELG